MKTKLPIRSLAQVNWMMLLVSTLFLTIFLFTYNPVRFELIYVIVHAGVNMLAISFMHVGLLLIQEKYIGGINELAFKTNRWKRYAAAYILSVVFTFALRPVRNFFVGRNWHTSTLNQQLITVFIGSIALNILILMVHNLVLTYHVKNETELENAELKAANAEANNLLLKQQIQPHFLFNALNILKSLYKKDTGLGDEYIVHLSNFLRASISNTSEKIVPLSEEIKICTDYIAMQKIRFGNALQYDIKIDDGKHDLIPSFSLQPLLENAIKHNDATNQLPLMITVFKEGDYIVVQNNLQRKKQPVASTGYGLTNLMKRYELIAGEEIIIQEDDAHFTVRLKILKA